MAWFQREEVGAYGIHFLEFPRNSISSKQPDPYKKKKMREEMGLPEILRGFRGNVREELHLDSSGGDSSDGDVEEDDWILRVWRPLMPLHHSSISSSNSNV